MDNVPSLSSNVEVVDGLAFKVSGSRTNGKGVGPEERERERERERGGEKERDSKTVERNTVQHKCYAVFSYVNL